MLSLEFHAVGRLVMFVVVSWVGASLYGQVTESVDASSTVARPPTTPDAFAGTPDAIAGPPDAFAETPDAAAGNRPLAVTPLPGSQGSQLTSSQQYISTLASFLGTDRSVSTSSDLSRYYRSRSRANLLRIPEMFGDFRSPGNQWAVPVTTINTVQTEIPVSAGIGGLRIAEDNQALPADRFWISYNHFHNAYSIQPGGPGAGVGRDRSLNRIVLAREFLLDEGRTSIEVRMPFGSAINVTDEAVTGAPTTEYQLESDSIGNFSVILKRLVYADNCAAWSMGLGIETPTGSSASITSVDTQVVQESDAVHLVPYLAMTQRFDRWFGHAFAQLDVATEGDDILARLGPLGTLGRVGQVDRAPLLGLDVGVGYWLKQPCCSRSWGVAWLAELHHTTALGDGDVFSVTSGALTLGVNTPVGVSDDLLNATTGIVISPGNGWSLRSAIVAPVRDERVFDTEAVFQLNRTF